MTCWTRVSLFLGGFVAASMVSAQPPERPAAGAVSAIERHEQAVQAFNAQDADAVADMYAPNGVLHDPQAPSAIYGRMAIRDTYAQMFRTFPDIEVSIMNRHVADGVMMYELLLEGTNEGPIATPEGEVPPTGERIALPAAVFATLDASGRFLETRRYYDVAEIMRQLGMEGAEGGK